MGLSLGFLCGVSRWRSGGNVLDFVAAHGALLGP